MVYQLDRLKKNADFAECAQLTVEVARTLYGMNSMELKAVERAWGQVGMHITTKM